MAQQHLEVCRQIIAAIRIRRCKCRRIVWRPVGITVIGFGRYCKIFCLVSEHIRTGRIHAGIVAVYIQVVDGSIVEATGYPPIMEVMDQFMKDYIAWRGMHAAIGREIYNIYVPIIVEEIAASGTGVYIDGRTCHF